MADRRPSAAQVDDTSAGEGTGLWSTILDSVGTTRGVVTKNLIVLGTSRTGKSTLISRVSSPTGEAVSTDDETTRGSDVLDLGLSYSCIDLGDDTDEEMVARLGVYQLASTSPPYPSLLPLALTKSTLLDSLVIIVLDWERPWLFMRDLRAWIAVLEGVLKGRGVSEGPEGAEGRERLEAHLRHYVEPASTTAAAPGPSSAPQVDTDTPLPLGVLTDNLGLGLVIVCTKADHINLLERERDFKEEQFDYIQQALRTIALKYGAGLFFTSHTQPASFIKLRAYLLRRLFSPSSPAAAQGVRPFPFPHRANVVDRDQVLVPTGWDSWGKIRVLRDRFDADAVGKGWELDMETERDRLAGRPASQEEQLDVEGRRVVGALRMYEEMVTDLDSENLPINLANSRVVAQDEQDFLKAHYETLQNDREKDPRAAFAARPGTTNGDTTYGASVVGPMSGAPISLPSVDRLLAGGNDGSPRENEIRTPPMPSTPQQGTTSSPAVPATPGAQNEVLANFFQSLLAKRSTTGSAPAAGVQGLTPPITSRPPGE